MDKHILLIDDDPIFHLISSRMINKVCAGLNVIPFLNGKIALEYLNKNYNIDSRYVILLDINMPVYNGWQFLDEIKKSMVQNNNIALFVVTSSTGIDDIKQAQSHSFVKGILTKPLSINTLKDIIQS